ncbi:FAD-binding oxidoreductase [Dasania sp. GY-19]|uniref:FAD-binding oxidoreductase n=1 Tax=Dasania phycosphaerae TaxID=2950436 RepID=A0A9J6RRM3_9GAMM|nr:FAD-binding oxidoreductase [Dasania phycosphaerae]MCZ0866807.1 FAD-binding oxidoreductase [Dasania phycosphaerae]
MKNNSDLPDIHKLMRRIKGEIILPSSAKYSLHCRIFNRAIHHYPALFVKVKQASDIPHALKYARKHKLAVSVRGGGHSACGSCLAGDGMVIDMRNLKDMKVYPQSKQISVAAGVLLHEVEDLTDRHDLVLPMGTCSTVGVVGSTLGGGVGFLSRKYGLLCDNVEKFTMVNAKGEFMQVDNEQNSDLFWALRGAGANQFGVITRVQYKLFDRPRIIYGGTISWPIKVAKKILQRYRDLLAGAPDDLFLYAFIPHSSKSDAVVSLFGFYLGDCKESENIFSQIRAWSSPLAVDLSYRPYMDLQSGHYEEELAVHWKHGFISSFLTDEIINILLDVFERCPENSGGIMLDPLGGEINRVDKKDTAFIHRDSQFICSITGLSSYSYVPDDVKAWVEESYQALMPFFNGLAYQNYEDLSLNEPQSYFGENLERLKKIKLEYDPNNLFCGSLTR